MSFSPSTEEGIVLFHLTIGCVCVCLCVCVCVCWGGLSLMSARARGMASFTPQGGEVDTFLSSKGSGDSFPLLHLGWDTVLFSPNQKGGRGSGLPCPYSWGAGLASTPSPESHAQVAGGLVLPRPRALSPLRPAAHSRRHPLRVWGGAGSAARGGTTRGPAPAPPSPWL